MTGRSQDSPIRGKTKCLHYTIMECMAKVFTLSVVVTQQTRTCMSGITQLAKVGILLKASLAHTY
jgi:hypothetical protein